MTAKYKLKTRYLAVTFPLLTLAITLLVPAQVTEALHLTCLGSATTANGDGTAGNDNMPGSENIDVMQGLAGTDTIQGFESDDKLCGGDDRDDISGGFGNDNIAGDNGNDVIDGDQGNDTIQAGFGPDNVFGDIGDDTLYHTTTTQSDADADTLDGWENPGDFDRCRADLTRDTVLNCEGTI